MMRVFFFSSLLSLIFSCTGNTKNEGALPQKDFILHEKDLVPEGMAFDNRTGIAYIGSMYKRKIVQLDSSGNVADFISSSQDGIWSVLGMEVDEDRGHLWAVNSQHQQMVPMIDPDSLQARSALHCYDLNSRKLVKKILCADTGIFLNDLTVAKNGDVYITESLKNRLYLLRNGNNTIERFLQPDSTWFMNGICFSEDEKFLYLGCWNGLMKVDLRSKKYEWVKTENGIDVSGIDGLSWYRNSLIAHQTDKVVRFYFNKDATAIVRADTLSSGTDFDIATTGEIGGNNYYFIVNSQVQSAYDFSNKTIKPMDSLEAVIIRRLPLRVDSKKNRIMFILLPLHPGPFLYK